MNEASSVQESAAALLLSPAEVRRISGGYVQAASQLAELQAQGFWRARRSRVTGEVILERAHYEAVCAGIDAMTAVSRKSKLPEKRVRD